MDIHYTDRTGGGCGGAFATRRRYGSWPPLERLEGGRRDYAARVAYDDFFDCTHFRA